MKSVLSGAGMAICAVAEKVMEMHPFSLWRTVETSKVEFSVRSNERLNGVEKRHSMWVLTTEHIAYRPSLTRSGKSCA